MLNLFTEVRANSLRYRVFKSSVLDSNVISAFGETLKLSVMISIIPSICVDDKIEGCHLRNIWFQPRR